MDEVGRPAVGLYWQSVERDTVETNIDNLGRVLPYLVNLHVFHYRGGAKPEMRPLTEGEDVWRQYLELVRTTGRDHWALLEFVRGETTQQFLEDAATLRGLVQ